MEPQTNTGQYSIVTLTLLGVVMLILSSAIGAILGPVFFPPVAGTQAQSMQVAQSNPAGVVIGSMDEVHMLIGKVTAINGNTLTLHLQQSVISNANLTDRMIVINNKTVVTRMTVKDQEAFQVDMNAYERQTEEAKKVPQIVLPPLVSINVPTKASEIRIGDNLTVTASENINNQRSFVASSIEIHGSGTTLTN